MSIRYSSRFETAFWLMTEKGVPTVPPRQGGEEDIFSWQVKRIFAATSKPLGFWFKHQAELHVPGIAGGNHPCLTL